MTEKFRAGDASEWNSHGHIGRGKVRKKLTARTLLKGHAVASDDATPDADPQRQPEARADDADDAEDADGRIAPAER